MTLENAVARSSDPKSISQGDRMKSRAIVAVVVVIPILILVAGAAAAPPDASGEYSKHFAALSKLSVAVAQAMPPEKYSFRPHPDSMTFGELMSHVAKTNYQFCAGLKDAAPPAFPSVMDKSGIVKFLSDSFEYCSAAIPSLSDEQMDQTHGSPDGRLPGRELLLALYIHVAHHRGQAEIYLRDNGVKPPSYVI
jgi:uncharacterized damage-inducible protein DinB